MISKTTVEQPNDTTIGVIPTNLRVINLNVR